MPPIVRPISGLCSMAPVATWPCPPCSSPGRGPGMEGPPRPLLILALVHHTKHGALARAQSSEYRPVDQLNDTVRDRHYSDTNTEWQELYGDAWSNQKDILANREREGRREGGDGCRGDGMKDRSALVSLLAGNRRNVPMHNARLNKRRSNNKTWRQNKRRRDWEMKKQGNGYFTDFPPYNRPFYPAHQR